MIIHQRMIEVLEWDNVSRGECNDSHIVTNEAKKCIEAGYDPFNVLSCIREYWERSFSYRKK